MHDACSLMSGLKKFEDIIAKRLRKIYQARHAIVHQPSAVDVVTGVYEQC